MPIPLPLPLRQENIRPQEDSLKVTQTPRGTRRDERGFHGQHNKSRDAVAAAAACLQNVIKIINASFDPSHPIVSRCGRGRDRIHKIGKRGKRMCEAYLGKRMKEFLYLHLAMIGE